MRPSGQMLGWNISLRNTTFGAYTGYFYEKLKSNQKIPPSQIVPSGPATRAVALNKSFSSPLKTKPESSSLAIFSMSFCILLMALTLLDIQYFIRIQYSRNLQRDSLYYRLSDQKQLDAFIIRVPIKYRQSTFNSRTVRYRVIIIATPMLQNIKLDYQFCFETLANQKNGLHTILSACSLQLLKGLTQFFYNQFRHSYHNRDSSIGNWTNCRANIFIQIQMSSDGIPKLVDIVNRAYFRLDYRLGCLGTTSRIADVLDQMRASMTQLNKLSLDLQQSDKAIFKGSKNTQSAPKHKSRRLFQSKLMEAIGLDDQKKGAKRQETHLHEESGSDSKHRLSRGPYRQYTCEMKKNVIRLHKQGVAYNSIARVLQIPSKNVIRWCRNGVQRKPGAGRKVLDPKMENNLYQWIVQKYEVNSQIDIGLLRQKALDLATVDGFSASLGWLKNFAKRYDLKSKYIVN